MVCSVSLEIMTSALSHFLEHALTSDHVPLLEYRCMEVYCSNIGAPGLAHLHFQLFLKGLVPKSMTIRGWGVWGYFFTNVLNLITSVDLFHSMVACAYQYN